MDRKVLLTTMTRGLVGARPCCMCEWRTELKSGQVKLVLKKKKWGERSVFKRKVTSTDYSVRPSYVRYDNKLVECLSLLGAIVSSSCSYWRLFLSNSFAIIHGRVRVGEGGGCVRVGHTQKVNEGSATEDIGYWNAPDIKITTHKNLFVLEALFVVKTIQLEQTNVNRLRIIYCFWLKRKIMRKN